MANSDAPFGLRPVRFLSGAPYNAAASVKGYAFDTSTALAIGDPVVLQGTSNTDGIPQYKRAAAAGPIDGVIVGLYSDVGEDDWVVLRDNNRTIPADTTSGAYVAVAVPAPDLLFEVQEDSVGENVVAAEVGLHANLVFAAPSAVNGISQVELDSSTAAADTTNGLAVKIQSLVERPDNATGANAKWYVTVVNSTYAKSGPSR